MGCYKNPAEMYEAKAEKWLKSAKCHWAKAKNGEHPSHFSKARKCYLLADQYKVKAANARATNAAFRRGTARKRKNQYESNIRAANA